MVEEEIPSSLHFQVSTKCPRDKSHKLQILSSSDSVATIHTTDVLGTLRWHLIMRVACWRKVGRSVCQAEEGLQSWGRRDKLGRPRPQRRAVSRWPHLRSKTHTCHTHTRANSPTKAPSLQVDVALSAASGRAAGLCGTLLTPAAQPLDIFSAASPPPAPPPPSLPAVCLSSLLPACQGNRCALRTRKAVTPSSLEPTKNIHTQDGPTMGCFQMATKWS